MTLNIILIAIMLLGDGRAVTPDKAPIYTSVEACEKDVVKTINDTLRQAKVTKENLSAFYWRCVPMTIPTTTGRKA